MITSWRDVPGWFDFQDIYLEAVAQAPQRGARFVELGVFLGRSTLFMGEAIKDSGKSIEFLAVDPMEFDGADEKAIENFDDRVERTIALRLVREHGSIDQAFCANLRAAELHRQVVFLPMTGEEAFEILEDASIDFLFIDAKHSREWMILILGIALRKVRKGGVIAGHDFVCARWPGVSEAVRKVFQTGFQVRGTSFWVRL